jgi:TonB family protein
MITALVFSILWQGAIVVGAAALILRFVPAENATTRYAGWFATLLALAVLPLLGTASHFVTLPLSGLRSEALQGTAFSIVRVAEFVGDAPSSLSWSSLFSNRTVSLVICVVWGIGTFLGFIRLAISLARISLLRRNAVGVGSFDGVRVFAAADLTIPIALGLFHPVIVLPSVLVDALGEKRLRCTIEHELAHIRRGDVVTNALQRIVEALLFWSPWVYIVGRWLTVDREAACDDWAVRRIGEPFDYAACLAALGHRIARKSAHLLTPGAFGSGNALASRIERLMGDRSPSDSDLNYRALGALATILTIIILTVQLLSTSTVRAASLQSVGSTGVPTNVCTQPTEDVQPSNSIAPDLQRSEWPTHIALVEVEVTVSGAGKVTGARIYRSSGNGKIDRATLIAAERSAYSPKLVNCVAQPGNYLFRAEFGPVQ